MFTWNKSDAALVLFPSAPPVNHVLAGTSPYTSLLSPESLGQMAAHNLCPVSPPRFTPAYPFSQEPTEPTRVLYHRGKQKGFAR